MERSHPAMFAKTRRRSFSSRAVVPVSSSVPAMVEGDGTGSNAVLSLFWFVCRLDVPLRRFFCFFLPPAAVTNTRKRQPIHFFSSSERTILYLSISNLMCICLNDNHGRSSVISTYGCWGVLRVPHKEDFSSRFPC